MRAPKSFLLTLCLVSSLVAGPAFAGEATAEVTFHRDIEPLFQENCQGCHRPDGTNLGGMIAPMSLITYEEVRPWAKSIARKVQDKTMPPWFASDHTRGLFTNERVLTAEQIGMVTRWAALGAPKGDAADGPAPREWGLSLGYGLGEPDLVIGLAEPFWINDEVRDINISLKSALITSEILPEPRWIKSVAFIPGSTAVHHIIASKSATNAEEEDASGMIGGIAPGTEPMRLPDGVGRLLVPDTQVFFQMHYNKEPGEGSGLWDHSSMQIWFHEKDHKVDLIAGFGAIGNNNFEIPPNHAWWEVGASKTFEYDTTIYSYLPHMHLRGAYAKYTAFYPDGTQELLLEVPKYDWNWQTFYEYKEPKTIPAGTRIDLEMAFNNTEERNDKVQMDLNVNRAVRFGGPTHEEMMLGFLDYAEHKPLDLPTETPSSGGE